MNLCAVSACLVLGACAVPRPDGSFAPKDDAGASQAGLGKIFETDAGKGAHPHDARAASSHDDAAPEPTPGAGEEAPTEPVDPSQPLAALAGRYLMRMDLYSTAEVKDVLATLQLRTRVSNLFVAEISLGDQDGHLVSVETLCDQRYAHTCEQGCKTWQTSIDPSLAEAFFSERTFTRDLEVDPEARTLKGAELTMAVGFDEVEGESKLPTSTSDARVWMLDEGGQERSGVLTHLTGSVPPLSVDCFVSSVARFATSFDGSLSSDGALSIEQASFALSTEGSDGRVIWAQGEPASYCSTSALSGQSDPSGGAASASASTQTVRFARFDGSGCPSATAFDDALPADPP